MKWIVMGGMLAIFLCGVVRMVYLQQFYNISMEQSNIESKLLTECKFTSNTPHCYVLLDKQEQILKRWISFDRMWHRNNK